MKAEKTKKIVTGTVFALVLLAGVFTLGFKAAHKPVVTETEETVTDNPEVQDSTEKKSADADISKKPESKKPEVKPAKDKVKTEDKNKEKPETKAEEQAAKPDSNKPVTPKPSKPSTPSTPSTPAPEVKPEPAPAPAPEVKPEPTPAPHTHSWTDVTEVRTETETYTEMEVVNHKLVGSHNVCNGCGCDLDSMGEMGMALHIADCGPGSYHCEPIYEDVYEPVEHTRTVQKTYVIGRQCSCGAFEPCDPYPIG